MSLFVRAGFALAAAIALCGCFKSDYPLLDAFNSVAPLAEGSYSYVDTDMKRKTAVVTHDGVYTKFITTEDDGKPLIQTFLMRSIGDGYYAVMDDQNEYGLIEITSTEVIEFKHGDFCDSLVEIANMEASTPSEYGVAEVSGDISKTCTFASVDGLVEALTTLVERDAVDPMRTYTRQ